MRINFPRFDSFSESSFPFSAWMVLCLSVLLAVPVRADVIVMKNRREVRGNIIEEHRDWVRILTLNGTLTLSRDLIDTIKIEETSVSEANGDMAWRRNSYYEALKSYKQARNEPGVSDGIEKKIEDTLKKIEQREKRKFDSLFRRAIKDSEKGHIERAKETYHKIKKNAPDGGPSKKRATRGVAYQCYLNAIKALDTVDYPKAEVALWQAVNEDPSLPIAHLELARFLLRRHEDDLALTQYEIGLEQAQKDIEIGSAEFYGDIIPEIASLTKARLNEYYFDQADLLYMRGEKVKSAEKYMVLLERGIQTLSVSKKEQALLRISDAYTDEEVSSHLDRDVLHSRLDLVLSLDPSFSMAWFTKGKLYYKDGLIDQALGALTHAIDGGQTISDLYLYRARCYLSKKDPEAARRDLLKELGVRDRYDVRYELGEVDIQGLDYDAAMENFDSAVQMDSERIPALLGRGQTYRLMANTQGTSSLIRDERLNLAEKDIDHVLEKKPNNTKAILEKGRILNDKKQYDLAFIYFTQVIDALRRMEERDAVETQLLAQAYSERGSIHLQTKNKNQALDDFNRALLVKPDFAEAYNRLGLVSERLSQFENAEQFYLTAIKKDPKNSEYELSLGLLYHKHLKNYPQAIVHYKEYQNKGGMEPRVNDWIRECNR